MPIHRKWMIDELYAQIYICTIQIKNKVDVKAKLVITKINKYSTRSSFPRRLELIL